MSQSSSTARWIDQLRAGDADALTRLCDRYYEQLARVAQQKLRGASKRVADEFAIANEVLHDFQRRVRQGDFDHLKGGDLMPLLVRLTHDRVVDELRRLYAQKRGGGRTRGDSIAEQATGLDWFAEAVESPSTRQIIADQVRAILEKLPDDSMRSIFVLRTEGYTNEEIARELDVSTATVERKRRRIKAILADFETRE